MSKKKLQLPDEKRLRVRCGACLDDPGWKPIQMAIPVLRALHRAHGQPLPATVKRIFLGMPKPWRDGSKYSALHRILVALEGKGVVERAGKQGHAVIWRRVEEPS